MAATAATPKAPFGNVTYADPGLQSDKQKRYPVDTEAHAKAAWAYINMPKNAALYSAADLAKVKGSIKAALIKFGVKISEDQDAQRAWRDPSYPMDGPNTGPVTWTYLERTYPLEDIHIQRTADGRTVEAYATPFDIAAEICDPEGHYMEVIDPTAFNKVLSDVRPHESRRNWQVGVFYNHASTLHGTPSESGSVPIGVPLDIRPDSRGLLTVTRYAKTPLADEVLELIREGAITGQSFTGRIVRSTPELSAYDRRAGGYRQDREGRLTTVRRMELGLREYGPTPMPAYKDAAILSVRSLTEMQQDTPSVEDAVERRGRSSREVIRLNRAIGVQP